MGSGIPQGADSGTDAVASPAHFSSGSLRLPTTPASYSKATLAAAEVAGGRMRSGPLKCVIVTENRAVPRGGRPDDEKTLSNAERQARHRAHRLTTLVEVITRPRRPIDRRSCPQRWRDAVRELLELQATFADWLATLLEGLRVSRAAETLEAIVDLDLTKSPDLPRRRPGGPALDGAPCRSAGGRVTISADKGYDTQDFVAELRELNVTPHTALGAEHQLPTLGDRRLDHPSSRRRRQPAHHETDRGGTRLGQNYR
jgi:hypothetical protein